MQRNFPWSKTGYSIMCLSWEHETYYRLQSHIIVNSSDFKCFLSQKYFPHFTSPTVKPNHSPASTLSYSIFSCFFQALVGQFLRSLILIHRGYKFSQHPEEGEPSAFNFSIPVQVFPCSTIAKTQNMNFFSWLPLLGERWFPTPAIAPVRIIPCGWKLPRQECLCLKLKIDRN